LERKDKLPNGDKGVLGLGFSLAMRHQRILWWVFAANFVLGGLGASGTARALGSSLHHSLAGERLTSTFDLGMLAELINQPDVKLFSHSGGLFLFAALYFLFLLFVTPGIISVYLEDRKFTTGEFCGAAGEFFWTFVRLALWSLIPFFLVHFLQRLVSELANHVSGRVAWDPAGFDILVVGSIPLLLAFVWVRLWFDLAQVRAVAANDRYTRRNVVHTFRIAIRRGWRAYWAYVTTCIVVWIITLIVLMLWTRVPGRAVPVAFVLLEIIMLAHIFARLWQKACITTWYKMNPEPGVTLPQAPFEPSVLEIERPTNVGSDVDAPLASEVEPVPEVPSDTSALRTNEGGAPVQRCISCEIPMSPQASGISVSLY